MLGDGAGMFSETTGVLLEEVGTWESGVVTGSMGQDGSIALMRESIVDSIFVGKSVFHVVLNL